MSYFRIPLEKVVLMLEHFRIFHLAKAEVSVESESQTIENDPLKAKDDWVSIDESELSASGQKKRAQISSQTKSFPTEPR